MKFRVFCDFDGTVAKNDVGNLVFTQFGDADHWWKLVNEWRQGHIDGRDLWRRQCEKSKMTEQELDKFAATQPLDPTFKDFVSFCRMNDIPMYIVSDGMDAYISRILKVHGLEDLVVRSNHLEMDANGQLSVEFPYYERGCGSCANCKGLHVKEEKQAGETTLFVGDGYSDKCALAAADITFAKADLLKHCQENNISCRPFNDFSDVKRELQVILEKA